MSIPEQKLRVNAEIRGVRGVRLIGTDGAQIGVVAFEDALAKAREAGLDLVEVSPEADPPVCRILDFGKLKYGAKRKAHVPVRKQHFGEIKEIRVRPKIDKHDLERKLAHGRELLEDGYRLLLTCVFRGREMHHLELGTQLLNKAVETLADVSKVERGAVQEGRRMGLMLMPRIEVVRTKTREREQLAKARAVEVEAHRKKSKRRREEAALQKGGGPGGPEDAEAEAGDPVEAAGADQPLTSRIELPPMAPAEAAGAENRQEPTQETENAQAENPQGTSQADQDHRPGQGHAHGGRA